MNLDTFCLNLHPNQKVFIPLRPLRSLESMGKHKRFSQRLSVHREHGGKLEINITLLETQNTWYFDLNPSPSSVAFVSSVPL